MLATQATEMLATQVYYLDVALCLRKIYKLSPNIISGAFPFRKWGEKALKGEGVLRTLLTFGHHQ